MSETLIVYATKHGSTEECAKALASQMTSESDLINLKESKQIDINAYSKIIIGGSIYAGRIQKEISEFCSKNKAELSNKKLGFFICCMAEGEVSAKQIEASFPTELLNKALAKEGFGGKFDFRKMNFLEKIIVKKVAHITADQSNLSDERISQFAQIMNEA